MDKHEASDSDKFGVPVYMFSKSQREQIRISLNEYLGFDYIDIRTFYLVEDGFRPSKKGITIKKDLYPELFRGITDLGDMLGYDAESLLHTLDN